MKQFIYLILTLIFIASCATKNTIVKNTKVKSDKDGIVRIENDSLEYQIIIYDIKFSNYLEFVAKPMSYYTIDYLETKNIIYVSEWNDRFLRGLKPNLYENKIDFDSSIHYGLEVNYKLFNYFKYVEREYGEKF